MVLEVVQIKIKPGTATEFEGNFAKTLPIYAKAKGWNSTQLRRSIETPNRYIVLVDWDSVDDHMVDFKQSEGFEQFRALIGHCLDGATIVEHGELVVASP